PDGTSRSFTYDAQGNLLTATDQLGKQTAFTYNSRGQMLTTTNRTGGAMIYSYVETGALKGNLATSKDSGTGETTYTYDPFSRLTQITHPITPPDVAARHIDIAYDAADRIASITDERGKTFAYSYDANDNVTVVTDPTLATTTL